MHLCIVRLLQDSSMFVKLSQDRAIEADSDIN